MKSDIIELVNLYVFAREHPDVPHRTQDKDVYKRYRCEVTKLMVDVPPEPGWYMWFKKGEQRPIYIGQSHEGKTSSLRARVLEELLEEYAAIWACVDEQAGEILRAKYQNKYSQKRALKKCGADAIGWVSLPGAKRGTLDIVEHKLIWELQPPANTDRRDYSEIQLPVYQDVFGLFQKQMLGLN